MRLLANGRRKRWKSEQTETPDPKQQYNLKLNLLRLAVVIAFALLTVQLVRLQLIRGAEFEERAELNQLRVEPIVPARGLIYDRNGNPVVENVPSFAAAVVPADLPRDRTLQIAARLDDLLGVPAGETAMRVEAGRQSNNPFIPVIVQDGLDRETAFLLREQVADMPGVQVIVEAVRRYTAGPELADVLGYIGRIDEEEYAELGDRGYIASDLLGKTGVEAVYEQYLRGRIGAKEIEKDASGREIRVLNERPALPGSDVHLAIDIELQHATSEILRRGAGENQAAAVVMDVNTGEVLAMVSLPVYDNNIFSGKIDEDMLERYLNDPRKPLVNHAISEQYPPGSIFKQITGAAALEEGVAFPSTTITSHGFITIPSEYDPSVIYTFRDWQALGTLDFYGGMAMSSDVYFYYLAGGYHAYGNNFNGLGVERLAAYSRAFGLGRQTGIDLLGETTGNLPDPEWKEETYGEVWTIGDTYNMGIGQGFVAVTPIQMVRMTAAIANGGQLLTPRVVREVRDGDGKVIVPNEAKVESTLPVSQANLATVRESLRQAVTWGTASGSAVSNVAVSGKTGTAEFGQQRADGRYDTTHGWYTGYAPTENPEIAVVVFLEHGGGGLDAAPLASEIFDFYFNRPLRTETGGAPTGQQP
jgi:penicillin-binding protein 2